MAASGGRAPGLAWPTGHGGNRGGARTLGLFQQAMGLMGRFLGVVAACTILVAGAPSWSAPAPGVELVRGGPAGGGHGFGGRGFRGHGFVGRGYGGRGYYGRGYYGRGYYGRGYGPGYAGYGGYGWQRRRLFCFHHPGVCGPYY